MKIKITRIGFEGEAREYEIKCDSIVLAAAEALEKYREDYRHAIDVTTCDGVLATVKTIPCEYVVEKLD